MSNAEYLAHLFPYLLFMSGIYDEWPELTAPNGTYILTPFIVRYIKDEAIPQQIRL